MQEKELGPIDYAMQVFIPSVTYNVLSRNSSELSTYYYSMPWEYNADLRGGVVRNHAEWAGDLADMYFSLWE